MAEYKITIPGKLPGLNEYIEAERRNRYKAAKMKANSEKTIMYAIRQQVGSVHINKPVFMYYLWVEPNRRRDRDNVAFAKKFIQDALVKSGVLKNDGWKEIAGFSDDFKVDRENPRVEVLIKEV